MPTPEEQIAELEKTAAKAEAELNKDALKELREVTIDVFLSPRQVETCLKLAGLMRMHGNLVRSGGKALTGGELTKALLEQVIEPNMARITQKLNEHLQGRGLGPQENDPKYWAYAVTYVMTQLQARAR